MDWRRLKVQRSLWQKLPPHLVSATRQATDGQTRPGGWGYTESHSDRSELQDTVKINLIKRTKACEILMETHRTGHIISIIEGCWCGGVELHDSTAVTDFSTHTCKTPPRRAAWCELHHTRGKHKPEEQPADQPESHTVMFSDGPRPPDNRQWSNKDTEEPSL